MPYNLLCNMQLRLYRYSGYCCRYCKCAVSKFEIAYIRNSLTKPIPLSEDVYIISLLQLYIKCLYTFFSYLPGVYAVVYGYSTTIEHYRVLGSVLV